MHGLLGYRFADLVVGYSATLDPQPHWRPVNEANDRQVKLAARGKFSPPSALPSMLCKPLLCSVSTVKQNLLQTFRKDVSTVRLLPSFYPHQACGDISGTKEVHGGSHVWVFDVDLSRLTSCTCSLTHLGTRCCTYLRERSYVGQTPRAIYKSPSCDGRSPGSNLQASLRVSPASHSHSAMLTHRSYQTANMTSLSALVRAALILAVAAQGALAQQCTCNQSAGVVDYVVSQRCCTQTGGVWNAQRRTCDVQNRPSLFTNCCIAAGIPFQPCFP